MDERAEIWIARDPDTNEESRPVSLRKLRKGMQIGRLKETTMVTRVGSTTWVPLERFLREAEAILTADPPQVAEGPPRAPTATSPEIDVEPDPPVVAAPAMVRPIPPRPRSSRPPPPVMTSVKAEPAKPLPPIEIAPTPPIDVVSIPVMPPPPVIDVVPVDLAATPSEPPPSVIVTKSLPPPPVAMTKTVPPMRITADDSQSLTAHWFTQSMPPEADPEDDEPFFPPKESLLDLHFERVMSVRLVRLAYVLLMFTLAGVVLVSLVRVLAALAAGDGPQIATAIATVPVVILACAVVFTIGRMMLEVLLAVFKIADRLTALAKQRAR